jgi:chemotaxis protein MotB
LVFASAACGVSQELYLQKVNELEKTQGELTRLKAALGATRSRAEEAEAELTRLREEHVNLSALHEQLRADMQATRTEMEELRRIRAQAEARHDLYARLAERLEPLVAAGSVSIEKVENKRIVVRVPSDLLFDPGKAELKTPSVYTLRLVANALKELPNERRLLVTGHTDNQIAKGSPFVSNWDLSAARAVAVVRFLQTEGVSPRRLAGAGASEFDRLAENDGEVGRARNRRIEIAVMPTLEELPSIVAPIETARTPPGDPAPPPAAPPPPPASGPQLR